MVQSGLEGKVKVAIKSDLDSRLYFYDERLLDSAQAPQATQASLARQTAQQKKKKGSIYSLAWAGIIIPSQMAASLKASPTV
jgi:hypothetical protein